MRTINNPLLLRALVVFWLPLYGAAISTGLIVAVLTIKTAMGIPGWPTARKNLPIPGVPLAGQNNSRACRLSLRVNAKRMHLLKERTTGHCCKHSDTDCNSCDMNSRCQMAITG